LNDFGSSNKTKKVILAILIIVSIAAASLFLDPINRQRKQFRLTYTEEPTENTPPGVAFTTQAMGAFRNLIIDILWVRAMNIMETGNYFEAAQIYNMIIDLEPHFAEIYVYAAWNLAYNVSVNFPPGPQRWIWVRKGIEMLVHKGIPRNTRSPEIYEQLGTIYWHKIGMNMDDAHWYYKTELARQMERVLGDYVRDIKTVAEAYRNRDRIRRREDVKALDDELKQNKIDLFKLDLGTISTLPDTATRILEQPSYRDAAQQYLLLVRAQYLAETMRMDPIEMAQMEQGFNWFDWRLPEVHALYWYKKAVYYARQVKAIDDRFYDQRTQHALKSMFDRGRIVETPAGDLMFLHDLSKTDGIHKYFLKLIDKYDDDRVLRNAHRNWLQEASRMHFAYGEIKKARELYYEVIKLYKPEKAATLFEVWVRQQLRDDMISAGTKQAEALITGSLRLALMANDAGEVELAEGIIEDTKAVYDKYQAEKTERLDLPPWDDLMNQAVQDYKAGKEAADRIREAPTTETPPG